MEYVKPINNLLNQKDEIENQINNAKLEIEMGDITNDEEMKKTAQSKMDELNSKKSEIEAKIKIEQEKEQEKSAKKKELEEKYPNQKTFHTVELMSEEGLKELAEMEAAPKRAKKAELETIKENLSKKKEEIENRIESIKEEFKQTHNPTLMEEAKKEVKELTSINQDIKENAAELEKVGPTEFDLEEFRAGMFDSITIGSYVKPGSKDVINYLQDKLKAGKSSEEIAKELNDYAAEPKIEAYSKFVYRFNDIAEMISLTEIWLDELTIPQNGNIYSQAFKEINKTIKALETAPYDARINNYKEEVRKSLEEIIALFEPQISQLQGLTEDQKSKIILQGEPSLKRKIDFNTKYSINILKSELAYRSIDEGFVSSRDVPSEGSVREAIVDYYDNYLRDNITLEQRNRMKKEKVNATSFVNEILAELSKKVSEEKRDEKQQVIDAITKSVKNGDGEIQPEDIENYLLLQEFIEEQREIVKTAIQNGEDINIILEDKTKTKGNSELQEMLNEVSPEEKTEEKAEDKIY